MTDAIAAYEAAETRMLALREQVSADREHAHGYRGHWPLTAIERKLWQARKDHYAARAALQVDEVDAGDLDVPLASASGVVVTVQSGPRRAWTFDIVDPPDDDDDGSVGRGDE